MMTTIFNDDQFPHPYSKARLGRPQMVTSRIPENTLHCHSLAPISQSNHGTLSRQAQKCIYVLINVAATTNWSM